MLVRLFGKNFRSLKDDFELSMVAADLTRKEDRDRGVIEVPIKGMAEPLRLLRCVGIYGANASGKSTVLLAAKALRSLGTDSSARTLPNANIGEYQPFLLDDKWRTAPIELGCEVVYSGVPLKYEIKFDATTIQSETLTLQKEHNEVKLIDRNLSGVVRGKLIKSSEANQLYVKEMQPNVSVLSKLAQFGPSKGNESIRPYYDAIRNATRFGDYSNATGLLADMKGTNREKFADDREYREWIMNHLIRSADVGICDVQTRREKTNMSGMLREFFEKAGVGEKLDEPRVVISFVHEGTANTAIEFNEESSGTKKLFNIGGDWWRLAKEPVTLFADELSASLHPLLLDRLVSSVNDAPRSVRSQLIFSTHDAGLFEGYDGEPPPLRRDQVYFTEKNSDGASKIYSLIEFKEDARPVHNIRKRYLSGLYGAIPTLEKLSL